MLCWIAEERDDLKALLEATLQRLEAVDEVLHRADVSTAMMEQKVEDANTALCSAALRIFCSGLL